MNAEAGSLDPALCSGVWLNKCAPIYGTLLRYDFEKKEFVGKMAESFDTENGSIWTLKLRDGVKFSDGTPFDAAAVTYNWDRIKDPATLSPVGRITTGMSWEVIDPLTVKLTLAQPNFQLPWQLTSSLGLIGSPAAMKALGGEFGSKPIGAGPFVLDKWTRDSQLEFSKNPAYFEEGMPLLDKLVIQVIAGDNQRLNSLRAGDLDVNWSLSAKDAAGIDSEGGFNVFNTPMVGGFGLMFNYKDPTIGDEGLRLALQHALDGEQFINGIFPKDTVVGGFFKTGEPLAQDGAHYPEYDLNEAQRLFDDYLSRRGRTSESISIASFAGIPVLEQSAQVLQAQLQKIKGLTVTIDAFDAPTMSQRTAQRKYQLMLNSQHFPELDKVYDVFHSGGALNSMGFANTEVDKALEITRTSDNPAAVEAAYRSVGSVVSENGPFRVMRYTTGYLLANQDVGGVVPMGTPTGAAAYWEYAWLAK
jgi:peptide/nickel transport system substrate-binding protein